MLLDNSGPDENEKQCTEGVVMHTMIRPSHSSGSSEKDRGMVTQDYLLCSCLTVPFFMTETLKCFVLKSNGSYMVEHWLCDTMD